MANQRKLAPRLALAAGLGLLTLGIGRFTLESRIAIDGPDRELTLVRDYKSPLPLKTLGLSLYATVNWPEWHYHAVKAQAVDADSKALPMNFQFVESGALVRLELVPKGETRKRFDVLLRVKEHIRDKSLHAEWQWDSKGKIAKVVDSLEWRIDLIPQGERILVREQIWARTKGGRARWFARFAPQIFLHQLAMPDMEKLITLKRPSPVIPTPQVHR